MQKLSLKKKNAGRKINEFDGRQIFSSAIFLVWIVRAQMGTMIFA